MGDDDDFDSEQQRLINQIEWKEGQEEVEVFTPTGTDTYNQLIETEAPTGYFTRMYGSSTSSTSTTSDYEEDGKEHSSSESSSSSGFFTRESTEEEESSEEILLTKSSKKVWPEPKPFDPSDVPFTYVSKEEWGAKPAKWEGRPLQPPVDTIRTAITLGEGCIKPEHCVRKIVKMQKINQDLEEIEDVPFNFMVGGDGRVYEGRGWYLWPYRPLDDPESMEMFEGDGLCYDFAFIGKYSKRNPVPTLAEVAMQDLINYGVNQGFIKDPYTLIPFGDWCD